MVLKFNQKIIFHSLSLSFIVLLLIAKNVNSLILVVALGLICANIYNIVNMMINYQEQINKFDTKGSRKVYQDKQKSTKFDVGRFQQKVRLAYQKNLSKNSSYIEEENKYWNSSYFNRSEKAEQLKNIKLTDLRKDRRPKFDEYENCFKQEGTTSKKIRNFFEIQQKQDEVNIKYLEELINSVFARIDEYKNTRVTQLEVKQALLTIDTYVNNKISNSYDQIANDFNEVNKFLQRCFSISFTLINSSSQASLGYTQLMEIIHLLQKKQVIPSGYTSSFSPYQIRKDLASIRKNLNNLPNLSLQTNILKLTLFMKYLQDEFKGQTVILSRFDNEQRLEGSAHLLKCQDNGKVYYNKNPKIKSRCTATPILVLIAYNFGQYSKSNRSLMKQLRAVFNL